MILRAIIIALAAAALLIGCAAKGTTPEGLDLGARNPKLKLQRTPPQAHPAAFDKVLLKPMELEFRPVDPLVGSTQSYQQRTEFPVLESDKKALATLFDKVLREQLGANRHFTLTDEPGAGVLVVRPSLRDIVSHLLPEEPPGRSDVFLDSIGEATLVVEFADGASGETFGSASDRREAETAGSLGSFGAIRANKVAAGHEVRLLARRWAMSLDRRIQQLYFEAKPR